MSKKPHRLHFLSALIFVMIIAASSLFLFSRVGLISSSACAQALYDHGCKTLRAVSSSFYPKVGDCSRKGRDKGRSCGKGRGKGYHRLLVSLVVAVMVVFCVLGEGEALKDGEAS